MASGFEPRAATRAPPMTIAIAIATTGRSSRALRALRKPSCAVLSDMIVPRSGVGLDSREALRDARHKPSHSLRVGVHGRHVADDLTPVHHDDSIGDREDFRSEE